MSDDLYEVWARKPLWTIEESWALFNGKDPEERVDVYRRNEASLFPGENMDETFLVNIAPPDLVDLVNRHVAAKNLIPFKVDGSEESHFKPKDMFLFFIKYTEEKPPQALFDALGIKEKAQPTSEAALKNAYKNYVSEKQAAGIIPSWKDDQKAMQEALGKKQTDKQIKQIRAKYAPITWRDRGRRKKSV